MNQPNLYAPGDIVWVTEQSCHARVEKVFRPVGDAHYRYTVETDDGDILGFVEEDRLYPSRIPPVPTKEEPPKPLAKVLYFPGVNHGRES